MQKDLHKIIISRTDGIGDVILTLPIISIIKKYYPNVIITFLTKIYTKPIIECCKNIDEIIIWQPEITEKEQINLLKNTKASAIIHVFPSKQIAKAAYKANIPIRIGSSHRWFHLFTCNKLVHFTRKRSSLHEAQLNMKLLKPLYINTILELKNIPQLYSLKVKNTLTPSLKSLLSKNLFNLILHPKTKGSAREWGIENYKELIKLLPANKYKIFITGTKEEQNEIMPLLENTHENVIDLTGKITLSELISFINEADGIIACSTGPLHIAAALNKVAIGIFPPIKPMHPGRWAPIGDKAQVIYKNIKCSKCRKSKICECITTIKPQDVINLLEKTINS